MRTGSDYLASLANRACNIYIGGERVEDVRTHPQFAEGARSIARLYDLSSDPANHERLTHLDPENDRRYNNIWLKPRSPDDLEARNRVHRAWADATWGLIGRSPDHVAGWITGMSCNAEVVSQPGERYGDNIHRYYDYARDRDLYVTYAIVLPAAAKQATSKVAAGAGAGQFANGLRVVEEREDGLVVSGFKILVTSGAYADEIMFGTWQPLPPGQESLAVTFAIPVDTKGLNLISRRPYAALASSLLDDPLASRFDEGDLIAYLDNVFVPWSRVFTYNSVERAGAIINKTPAHALGNVQAHTRLLSKMRLILGLTKRVMEHNGVLENPAVKDIVGKIAVEVSILEGLVEAENAKYETWPGGYVAQSRHIMYATMAWTQGMFPQVITTVRELLASHALQQPADVSVFDNPDTRDIYSRFMQMPVEDAIETYKLMRMIWDLVGTEFASRHTQYEMFYNGPQFGNRLRLWSFFPWQQVDSHAAAALASMGGYEELVTRRPRKDGSQRPHAVPTADAPPSSRRVG